MDIFNELIDTKKKVLSEFEITNGGVKTLNKIIIEDWAPKDKMDEDFQKEGKKKKKNQAQTEKEELDLE